MADRLWNPQRIQAGYRFAAEAHRGQIFPGTDLPYLLHVSQVSMEVMTALCVEAEDHSARNGDLAVCCALLHDVLEDTAVDRKALAAAFGADVAAGVAALTKDPALPAERRMADSLRRIRQQPPEVWMVKLADRISNLQAPPAHWSTRKRLAYRAEAESILASLGDASPFLAKRLQTQILTYADYCREGA